MNCRSVAERREPQGPINKSIPPQVNQSLNIDLETKFNSVTIGDSDPLPGPLRPPDSVDFVLNGHPAALS